MPLAKSQWHQPFLGIFSPKFANKEINTKALFGATVGTKSTVFVPGLAPFFILT